MPLNIASFPFLPGRTIAMLSPDGAILSTESFANAVPGGLRNPRSVGWNVELDRQLTSALVVRAGFQERNTARDFVLDPLANVGLLSLSNDGRSFYREFQLTGQYKVRRGTLNASYVRSKAFGNLNDFNQFFGNNATAVINPDEQGRLPFDAPNRFLAWGQFDAPFKLTVLPFSMFTLDSLIRWSTRNANSSAPETPSDFLASLRSIFRSRARLVFRSAERGSRPA